MRFKPKTEEELQTASLLPEGTYPFEVVLATNETSKNGNPMMKISLQVWDSNGKIHLIIDYLLEAMAYKLRHFCEATNLLAKYESGELHPTDCMNKKGEVEIIIQEGKFKADGTQYFPKNSVKDYVRNSAMPVKDVATIEDSDIPF